MQITEIYYEKVFPIAPYVNEKIGVKVLLSEDERDHPTALEEAFTNAKRIVGSWGHKLVEERPDGISTISHDTGAPYSNDVIREPDPIERKPALLVPDKAIRVKYAKAVAAKEEETIQLLENMYDFNASQK